MRIRKANLRLELRCWGCRAGPWSWCFSKCVLAPPLQDNAVVENNQQLVLVDGGDGTAGSAAEDVQASLENALVGQPEQYWLMAVKAEQGIVNAEQTLANGVLPAAMPSPSTEIVNGRAGRKRGRRAAPPAGSRCTRSNGKKWRCERPTDGQYFLCQYHHKQAYDRSVARRKAKAAAAAAAALAAVPAAEPAVPLAVVPADEPVGPLAMVAAPEAGA